MKQFLMTVLAVALLVAAMVTLPLLYARQAWMAGHYADALAAVRSGGLFAEYRQVAAASALMLRKHDDPIRGGRPLVDILPEELVAGRLFAARDYNGFLAYDAAFGGDAAIYRAAANVVAGRLDRAEAALQAVRGHERERETVQRAVDDRKAGRVPLVFDREGEPIAELRGAELVATDPDFASLIDHRAGELTIGAQLLRIGSLDTLDTTLDPFIQHAAVEALGKYRGAIVAIDPRTNELLAVASGGGSNVALERQYEPGSVVKVLTGLNAFASGMDVKAIFPYECQGKLTIDGRDFGDWVPSGHGKLASIDDALAVSCNICFADLGLRLGRERLQRFMAAAGFDSRIWLDVMSVPLGKTVGTLAVNRDTALYAVGLEHESINALHLAMLASMMANRGVLTSPRLLRLRRGILGEVTWIPPRQDATRLAPAAASAPMIEAMRSVTTDPRGTGHRAPVDGISVAMKTGTAGQRPRLDALIMAFAPVETPKVAFAVIAEDAGPAELAGAEIAHKFLAAIRSRL